MMFGFGDEGNTNLITRALASVGKRVETIEDPVQIHYHLPDNAGARCGLAVGPFAPFPLSLLPRIATCSEIASCRGTHAGLPSGEHASTFAAQARRARHQSLEELH